MKDPQDPLAKQEFLVLQGCRVPQVPQEIPVRGVLPDVLEFLVQTVFQGPPELS